MDEMTQQNAALVEEAAASSKSMEEQSQALLDQVAFFNNGEEEAPEVKTPVRRSKVSTRKPTRPAVRTAPKPRGKRTKTETDQEWEEF
jgi:methyl-accepting chemotaxis protein